LSRRSSGQGTLEIVDQRKLPGEFVKLRCRSTEQLYEAITTLAVRGAPAIGVAGAYGLVLAGQNLRPGQSLGLVTIWPHHALRR